MRHTPLFVVISHCLPLLNFTSAPTSPQSHLSSPRQTSSNSHFIVKLIIPHLQSPLPVSLTHWVAF
ncbi:hypothetical protein GALMADRAFT_149185 [Galerina marginata CBS 339.88]|uniref:Secreted protein n=1 Tax=Galerina marginata (strain CBS 339.88) TaxID=685588 RepID=A0A067S4V4_GALM3|nr:hypothetical protein GALMADRAFT_149185 [Galerina marginata CBS 339.88]